MTIVTGAMMLVFRCMRWSWCVMVWWSWGSRWVAKRWATRCWLMPWAIFRLLAPLTSSAPCTASSIPRPSPWVSCTAASTLSPTSGPMVSQLETNSFVVVLFCVSTGFAWSLKVFQGLGKMGYAFPGHESLGRLSGGLWKFVNFVVFRSLGKNYQLISQKLHFPRPNSSLKKEKLLCEITKNALPISSDW